MYIGLEKRQMKTIIGMLKSVIINYYKHYIFDDTSLTKVQSKAIVI